jgi:MurNAc alpha-1-phosphate uridylyltransferase
LTQLGNHSSMARATRDFPVAILCGGLGTRMQPFTATLPKALIPIDGEPFLFHLLRLLSRNGFTNVVLCVSHFGEMIEEAVGDGGRFGLAVSYSFDGPTRIGTAGAIRKALSLLGDAFFVLFGDSYLDCDYAAIASTFDDSGAPGLMTVYHNRNALAPSNVRIEAGRIVGYAKAIDDPRFEFIDYGAAVFAAETFAAVPIDTPTDLSHVITSLIATGSLAHVEVFERFFEIGSPEGLRDTTDYLRRTLRGNEARGASGC